MRADFCRSTFCTRGDDVCLSVRLYRIFIRRALEQHPTRFPVVADVDVAVVVLVADAVVAIVVAVVAVCCWGRIRVLGVGPDPGPRGQTPIGTCCRRADDRTATCAAVQSCADAHEDTQTSVRQ